MYINKRSIFILAFASLVLITCFLSSAKDYVLTCDVSANTCTTYRKNYSGHKIIKTHTNPYDVKDLKVKSRSERYHSRYGTRTRYYYDVCFVNKSNQEDCFYTASTSSSAEEVEVDLKRMFQACRGCKQIKYDLIKKVQL